MLILKGNIIVGNLDIQIKKEKLQQHRYGHHEDIGDMILKYEIRQTLVVKNLPANAGDIRETVPNPGLGRSLGVGNGNPFQNACWRIPWTEEL